MLYFVHKTIVDLPFTEWHTDSELNQNVQRFENKKIRFQYCILQCYFYIVSDLLHNNYSIEVYTSPRIEGALGWYEWQQQAGLPRNIE